MAATCSMENLFHHVLLCLLLNCVCLKRTVSVITYQDRRYTIYKPKLSDSGSEALGWTSGAVKLNTGRSPLNINAILSSKVLEMDKKNIAPGMDNFQLSDSQAGKSGGEWLVTMDKTRGSRISSATDTPILSTSSSAKPIHSNWAKPETGKGTQLDYEDPSLKPLSGRLIRSGHLSQWLRIVDSGTGRLIGGDLLTRDEWIPETAESVVGSRTSDKPSGGEGRSSMKHANTGPSDQTHTQVPSPIDTWYVMPPQDTNTHTTRSNLPSASGTVYDGSSEAKWSLNDKIYDPTREVAANNETRHVEGHRAGATRGIIGLLIQDISETHDGSAQAPDGSSNHVGGGDNKRSTRLEGSELSAPYIMVNANKNNEYISPDIEGMHWTTPHQMSLSRGYKSTKSNTPNNYPTRTSAKSVTTILQSMRLPPYRSDWQMFPELRSDADEIRSDVEYVMAHGRSRVRRDAQQPSPVPVPLDDNDTSHSEPLPTDVHVDAPGIEDEFPDDETAGLSYRAAAKSKIGYVEFDRPRSKPFGGGDSVDTKPAALSNHEEEPLYSGEVTEDASVAVMTTDAVITTVPPGGVPETFFLFENIKADSEPELEPEPADAEAQSAESEYNNVTGIPEGGSEAESEEDVEFLAEPYPDWSRAKDLYGASFEFHIYIFGISFAILAIYTFVCMIILRRKRNLLSKGYFMSLNSMLLIVGVSRSVYLLVDGYDSHRLFHPVISYILINLTFPSLTSAFSILFLALIKATRMRFMARRVEKPLVLVGIITFHFSMSIVVDITVGVAYSVRALFLVCQIAFIVWGLFLFCGYLYIFWKLYRHSPSREENNINSFNLDIGKSSLGGVAPTGSHANPDIMGTDKSKRWKFFRPKVMLTLALKVTLASAILGVINVAIVIYGMASVFNFLSDDVPEPWPYYSFHFCMRLVELGMCTTMSFVATQPLRYKGRSRTPGADPDTDCVGILHFTPCYRIRLEEDSDQDTSQPDHPATDEPCSRDPVTGVERGWLDPGPEDFQTTPMVNKVDQAEQGLTMESGRSRPSSMLYYDNGFVRFRQDGDSEGDQLASTDEELDFENGPPRYSSVAGGPEMFRNGQRFGDHKSGLLYPSRARNGHWSSSSRKNTSVPNTPSGWRTPATPRSLCSTDIDGTSGVFSFRPPSSIHLRDSIERELNYSDLHLRTPDNMLETVDSIQESLSLPRSPDALRASVYSYATATQDGTMSISPGRKLYSAQSFVTSSPSLSYKDFEMSGSGWFQRYFWEQFGDQTQQSPSTSFGDSLDVEAEEKSANKSVISQDSYVAENHAQTAAPGANRHSHVRNEPHKVRRTPYCRPR